MAPAAVAARVSQVTASRLAHLRSLDPERVTAGLPGPPLVLNFSEMNPSEMRGTSSSYILVVGVTGIAALALANEFGGDELVLTLALLPGVVIGLLAARWARLLLDRTWFRPAVLFIAMLGAVALVIRQLTA